MTAQQYALILKTCKRIEDAQKKTLSEIKHLQSVHGLVAAELNAIKERMDILANQPFIQAKKEP